MDRLYTFKFKCGVNIFVSDQRRYIECYNIFVEHQVLKDVEKLRLSSCLNMC